MYIPVVAAPAGAAGGAAVEGTCPNPLHQVPWPVGAAEKAKAVPRESWRKVCPRGVLPNCLRLLRSPVACRMPSLQRHPAGDGEGVVVDSVRSASAEIGRKAVGR